MCISLQKSGSYSVTLSVYTNIQFCTNIVNKYLSCINIDCEIIEY